jgi:hypothetical protein
MDRVMVTQPGERGVDFGPLPAAVDDLLQRGVVAYRRDRAAAERLFREALELAPDQLAVYFCLYKIHTYQGNLDDAVSVAEAGLREAARQAGWHEDFARWRSPAIAADGLAGGRSAADGPARFALYTLKALAFIHLKRAEPARAHDFLDALAALDPGGLVGWRVVADLANGVRAASPEALAGAVAPAPPQGPAQ